PRRDEFVPVATYAALSSSHFVRADADEQTSAACVDDLRSRAGRNRRSRDVLTPQILRRWMMRLAYPIASRWRARIARTLVTLVAMVGVASCGEVKSNTMPDASGDP